MAMTGETISTAATASPVGEASAKPSAGLTPQQETCWICRKTRALEEPIQPCLCNPWAHRSCLQEWCYSSWNPRDYRQCPDCLFRYRTRYTLVDSGRVAGLQEKFDQMYRKEMMRLWLRMLFLALFVLGLTTGFL
jgi:hypothetical protein